jgi:hypothetical protein
MLKRLLIVAFASVLLAVNQAEGAVIQFETILAPEVAGSSGTGDALVTLDTVAHTLVVNTTFDNLTGTVTVAHIHCCVDPPGTVGVATFPGTFPDFPAGVTSGSYVSPTPIDLTDIASYTGGFLTNFGGGTAAGAEAALLAGLLDGRAYLNIHTTFSPGGEIRGFLQQVQQVPEPMVLTMLGVGFAAAMARRNRRRRV